MWQKSPTNKAIILVLTVLLSFVLSFGFALSADAATVTWSGGGSHDFAYNPSNWSGGMVPQYGDDVVFDSTSKDCTWDITVTLASLTIASGYTGTVTLSSSADLTIAANFVPPSAVTESATNINGNAATLNATANPNGLETTVYFEWGTDTSYENITQIQNIGSGTNNVSVSAFINRLSTNTTYHYRVVATNAAETSYGDDMSFTTTGGTSVSGRISTDTVWTFAGSPYIVTGSDISVYGVSEPTLTIEAGVEVRFNGTYRLIIGQSSGSGKGRLVAQGTASQPIIFTSNKNPVNLGDWYGLRFYNHASTESILEYVTVEYAGYSSGAVYISDSSPTIKNSIIRNSNTYGIYSIGSSSLTIIDSAITDNTTRGIYATGTGSLTLTGSTISNNGSDGVYVGNNASVSSTSFTNNGSYAISVPADVSLGTGNTFSGNSIELRGNIVVSTNTIWHYQGVSYIVTGDDISVYGASEPTLTIEAGVEVRFNGTYRLIIGQSSGSGKGRLVAQGTASQPIIFTSNKNPVNLGDWYGLRFYNHASTESILEYVTVEYAGYSSGAVYISDSSPTIKNSIIRLSNTYGIYSIGSSSPTIMFSTINNNGNYTVYSTASMLKVYHCNITNNGNGVYSSTGKIAVVRFNWWGDASGPSGQGSGTGQSVSTGINFEPWLGTPYTYPFYNTDFSASLQEFSPLNSSVNYAFSISENSNWTFSIKDSIGTTAKTFTGSGIEGTVTWDGKDESNVIVPDGIYTYQLSSTSLGNSSQSAPFIGDVVVGEELPKAEITYPMDGQFIGNGLLDIQGTADDSVDFKNYKLEYGLGTSPTNWTSITGLITTPVDASTLGTWNPSNLTGTYYTIRLSVNDNAGNTATDSVEVKLLNIDSMAVTDSYFSPNGDGSKDTTTITASVTYSSDWTVDIKNSGGTTIRTLTGSGGSISATWDGKDTSGVIQPEGEYSYTITATEPSSGATATKDSTSNITIDLIPPIAEITAPTANQEVYETVTITGTASDAVAKDYHKLYYGVGTNPSSYTQFASGTANVTNGTLGSWCTHKNCPTVPNGTYTIKLSVIDEAGNLTETTVTVIVKNAAIESLITSENFDPSANQSSAITYSIANGAFVTIKVGTNLQPFRVLLDNAKRPAGENTDYWDGRKDNGDIAPMGNTYRIAIWTTVDPDPMPVTAPRITDPLATPASFDPTTDIGATISYSLSKDAAVTVGIYDFDDNLIRNVVTDISQLQGNNSVIWDGKNNSGNYAYPGAYRYKIVATDSGGVTGPEVTGITQVYY